MKRISNGDALDVWSRHLVEWIAAEAFGLCGPRLADGLVGREASESFQSSGEVVGGDEASDGAIQSREIERGAWFPVPWSKVSGEGGENFGVDGPEEPFDFSSALGTADGRVDDADVQLDGGAFEVVAGEVGAVIHVQDVGQPAHCPAGITLTPDGLAECQGCVER